MFIYRREYYLSREEPEKRHGAFIFTLFRYLSAGEGRKWLVKVETQSRRVPLETFPLRSPRLRVSASLRLCVSASLCLKMTP